MEKKKYSVEDVFYLLAGILKDHRHMQINTFDAINEIVGIFENDVPEHFPHFIPEQKKEQ